MEPTPGLVTAGARQEGAPARQPHIHHFHCAAAGIIAWCATWISAGFDVLEAFLAADTERGAFCFGHSVTIADVYLVQQAESARRFKVDLARWPNIRAVDAACSQLDASRLAAPDRQLDAST